MPTVKADNYTRYGYTKLENDQQRTIYNNLVEAINKGNDSTSFTVTWTNQEAISGDFRKAVNMLRADYPEFFSFDNTGRVSLSYLPGTTNYTVTVPILYSMGGQLVSGSDPALAAAKTDLQNAVNSALAGMPKGSDYDKALYLHDYVAKKVEYVMVGDHQTAYGALVGGKAVCAGYARAYQLLLNAAGIDAWYVTGQSKNPSTGRMEDHGWNVVFLDGKSYYTDVTWDDQASHLFHAYFMLSRDEMGKTHFPADSSLLPYGNNTGMDYFTVKSGNGSGVGVYNGNETVSQVKNWMLHVSPDSWICEVKDNSHSFRNWLSTNLKALGDALGLKGKLNCTSHVLGDEVMFRIESKGHTFPLKKHDAIPADCKNGGSSVYYVCETCNEWFWDAEAKQPIIDHNSVKKPVADHQYTVWKNNDSQHWRICKVCSAEMPNSRTSHKDSNADKRCDECNCTVKGQTNTPTTSATTSITAPTQVTTVPATSATKPSTHPTTVPTSAPTTAPATVPSTSRNPTQQIVPSSTASSVSNPTQSSASQNTQSSTAANEKLPSGSASPTETFVVNSTGDDFQPADQNDGGNVILIVVFALAGCCVTAGAAIVFIRFRKK